MIKKFLTASLVLGVIFLSVFYQDVNAAKPLSKAQRQQLARDARLRKADSVAGAEEKKVEEEIVPSDPVSEIVPDAAGADTTVASTELGTVVEGGAAVAPQPSHWQRANAYAGSKAASAWQKFRKKGTTPTSVATEAESGDRSWEDFLNSEIPYNTAFGKKLGRRGYLGFGRRQTGTTYKVFAQRLEEYLAKFDEKAMPRLALQDKRAFLQWELNEQIKRETAAIEGTAYVASALPRSEFEDGLKELQNLKALFEQKNSADIVNAMKVKFVKSLIEEDEGYKLGWNWWLSRLYEVGTKKKAPARRTYGSSSSSSESSSSSDIKKTSDQGEGSSSDWSSSYADYITAEKNREEVEGSEQWRSAAPGNAYDTVGETERNSRDYVESLEQSRSAAPAEAYEAPTPETTPDPLSYDSAGGWMQ